MTLTSLSTLIIFGCFSLLLFLFVLLMWSRIFKPGYGNLAIRALTLLLLNFMIIVTVAIGINRSQGFFQSWSDLFGTSPTYENAVTSYNKAISVDNVSKGVKLKYGYVSLTETIRGELSNVSNQVTVLLPPSAIADIKQGNLANLQSYEIVEFLTGFPSQPAMWFKSLDIVNKLNNLSNTKNLKIIGVFPQVNIEGKFDLECMNLPGGHQPAETWLTDDMHRYMSARFGITNERWNVVGVSTGGWCATLFLVKRPDLYKGGLSIAGYYQPALPRSNPQSLQDEMKIKYELGQFESNLSNKPSLYIFASLGDTYSIRETKRFLSQPHPNLDLNYQEVNLGGHNSRVWKTAIEPGLKWLLIH